MKRITENPTSKQKSVVIAAMVSSFLMLVSGLGYRVLASRLEAPVDTTPIRPEILQQLPMQLEQWTGQDVPLEEAIVRATDTDAHVNRLYSRRNGLESVSLYIASGVRARDLMPHRPEVCYTGSGWTLTDRQPVDLPLSDGTKLPCNVLQFSRGTLNSSKVIVLDYYLVDGQYCRDVSLLRSKAWRGSGMVNYVAQIQIVMSIAPTQAAHSARAIIVEFAIDSVSSITELFESVVKDRHTNKDHSDDNKVYEGKNG